MEEYTLDQTQCAQVALYMYEQYKVAPSQKLMYLQFDEWLKMMINVSNTPAQHLHEDDDRDRDPSLWTGGMSIE
jgi:hypothetical protein